MFSVGQRPGLNMSENRMLRFWPQSVVKYQNRHNRLR